MMKAHKKLAPAMALALTLLFLASSVVLALGLGQIKVKSALNQPLLAEIPVVSATPSELKGLTVSLASNEDFQRAGILRQRLEMPLKFEVETREGQTVILVTTDEPVTDPALDLLLELNWANGKLLREYSVLLDPPGMPVARATQVSPSSSPPAHADAPAKPAATQPVATATPATSSNEAAVATLPDAPSAAADASRSAPTLEAGATYTADSGDSVWSIAQRSTASSGEINRMMLAIQRANPDAFYKDNINALKKGAVLRIPEREQMAAITAQEAREEVRRQNEVWSNPQAAAPSTLATSSALPAAPAAGSAVDSSGNRLELVPPGDDGSSGSGRTGVADATGDAAVTGLRQELARTKEALASEKQRGDDMAARVTDLESIRDKNQRLLQMKDAEIAELQNKLAQAGNAQPVADADQAPLRDDIFEPAEESSAEVTDEEQSGEEADELPELAETPDPAVAEPELAENDTDTLTQPETATVESEPDTMAAVAQPEISKPSEVAAPEPAVADAPVAVIIKPWYMQLWAWVLGLLVLLGLIVMMLRGRRGKSAATPPESLADSMVGADGSDGVIDDSEDERALLEEIERNPNELSLRLELASLYYAHRDQDKFEAVAEAMFAHVDDPAQHEWQQVRAMGEELCPDHPLFVELHSDGVAATTTNDDEPVSGLGRGGAGYSYDIDLTGDTASFAGDDGSDALATEQDEDLLSLSTLASGSDDEPVDDTLGETDFDLDSLATEPAPAGAGPVVDLADHGDSSDDALDATFGDVDAAPDSDDFSTDPVDTKLDLARAYQDMGDNEGARAMLEEVLQEGSEAQKDTARKLLEDLG